MASFQITFNVNDRDVSRVLGGLRKHWGTVTEVVETPVTDPETGEVTIDRRTTQREFTNAELQAKIRQMTMDSIRSIVMAAEAEDAARIARQSVKAIEIT